MPPYQQIIEGPAKTWRLVQKRAAIRRRGDDPDICKISQEDSDIESFYKVMTDRTIPQEVVEMSYPDHYRAMRWYLTNAPSSPRWHIEAWLLADGGLDNAIEHLGISFLFQRNKDYLPLGWRLTSGHRPVCIKTVCTSMIIFLNLLHTINHPC